MTGDRDASNHPVFRKRANCGPFPYLETIPSTSVLPPPMLSAYRSSKALAQLALPTASGAATVPSQTPSYLMPCSIPPTCPGAPLLVVLCNSFGRDVRSGFDLWHGRTVRRNPKGCPHLSRDNPLDQGVEDSWNSSFQLQLSDLNWAKYKKDMCSSFWHAPSCSKAKWK
jgi:hypothetical protein